MPGRLTAYRCSKHGSLLEKLHPEESPGHGFICWQADPDVALLFPNVFEGVNLLVNHDGGRVGTPDIRLYYVPKQGEPWNEEVDGST